MGRAMARYPGNPDRIHVLGLQSCCRRRRLGPGLVRVGTRRFWAEEVEVVIRFAVPAVWRPEPRRPGPSPGARR